jgi:hypothetical protein
MKLVNVRVKYGGHILTYDCGDLAPSLGDWVVARESDLVYLGQVVTAPLRWPAGLPAPAGMNKEGARTRRGSKKTETRGLVRLATPADLARQAENEVREREAFDYCQSRVEAQGLEMRLLAVEMVFDGSKTIFYYTADERVDFRLLVKELVSRFRTRIEMRQIGVRHKARLLGGLGGCGRSLCCCGFLSNFAPVSVKMAKEQGLPLSPAKISGVCGRLLCCLAFEHLGALPAGRPGETELELGLEDEPGKDHVSGPEP